MKKILGLLMMLFSLYGFAGTAIGEVEANQVVDVELKKGNPVIIYLTGGSLNEPEWVEGEEVPKNLHVMLLIGYNSKTNQIVINDPWTKTTTGKVYYSESKVVSIYNQVGKKAVVIR